VVKNSKSIEQREDKLMAAKVKMIWANLGVKDTGRTRKFYKALGFKPNEPDDSSNAVLASFLFGENGFVIHFFAEGALKEAIETDLTNTKSSNEVLFTISAEGRAEVDEWAEKAREAGGTVFSEPREFSPKEIEGTFYGCGFADPDGHRFNVLDTGGM
jgi:predicted lactoylglutathione lyase